LRFIVLGKEYRIGSQDCEILITENASVSRLHARLSVYVPENSPPGKTGTVNGRAAGNIGGLFAVAETRMLSVWIF
jgi:hypothetical protein